MSSQSTFSAPARASEATRLPSGLIATSYAPLPLSF